MTTVDIEARLADIFSALFDVAPDALNRGSSADDIPGWDSLQHLNLVVSIEQEFGITLAPEDAEEMLSFGLAADIVKEKLTPGGG